MLFLEKFNITDHAIEQYDYRAIKNMRRMRSEIIRAIKKDLRTMNVKKVVYDTDKIHVFTFGYKEFIFAKERGRFILKTFIRRNERDTNKTINIRNKQKNLVTN